jgi:RNA polymerase sigma-B factor
LSKAKTLDLLKKYRHDRAIVLRNQISDLNLGLVAQQARRWAGNTGEDYQDLFQVGSFGLLKAIERFDIDRGTAFSTYACPYIAGEIQHYVRDRCCSIRISRQIVERVEKAKAFELKFRKTFQRQPSDTEISQYLEISLDRWQYDKLACQNRKAQSLDIPMYHREDRSRMSKIDSIADPKYRSFQLAREDRIFIEENLALLDRKIRSAIELVYLQDLTRRAAEEVLGISEITVYRYVAKGIRELKKKLLAPPLGIPSRTRF